jgi:PPM family protein phosphatase
VNDRAIDKRSAGDTDPGLQRHVNEDRFYIDSGRGLFLVVDGIGGQAAGGKAADIAVAMLRKRLERETGLVADRVREAITVANNEIYRVAAQRPEWQGMACVLTVAVIEGHRATIGHVGDTRLYKLRNDRIEKVTRDHSPVGEREDAKEISEAEAMRHPRRNEVYRDVGSEPHESADRDFVDIQEIALEADAALLLCSDGLTDLVTSASIARIVRRRAGDAGAVARALIAAAKDAGGTDNVTVVYLEGEQFRAVPASAPIRTWRRRLGLAAVVLLSVAIGFVFGKLGVPPSFPVGLAVDVTPAGVVEQVVRPTESIMAVIARARPGSDVIVEPGEYREQLVLRDQIRVVSRVARGVTLRLPAEASEGEAAVVATGLSRAEISGFRIVGDAATSLGTGILVQNSALAIVDMEIAGATNVAVDFSGAREASLVGSEIRDNPGAAMAIRTGSAPRIAQNTFIRNGLSERAARSLIVEPGAHPVLQRNLFHGISPEMFAGLEATILRGVTHDNWFVGAQKRTPPLTPGPRQGR